MNTNPLAFRDSASARGLAAALDRVTRQIGRNPVSLMHVCGSHEQAMARFGLRAVFPEPLDVIMGPGCPVCITDVPEVDEAIALARQGVHIATYGDMLRVPGSARSLADARTEGGYVHVVYGIQQALDLARSMDDEVVFFATGFETTAVTTAAVALGAVPANFSILSAHKYIPPAMDLIADMPGSRIEGFLAAGHAAAITGWGIFEDFATRHGTPVVVAGFEPLDILAGLVRLAELVRDRDIRAVNMFPRCVTRAGNLRAQEQLWRVFRPVDGRWRGVADVPDGNLRLRDEWAPLDARRRFTIDLASLWDHAPAALAQVCVCGDIMAGLKSPADCPSFGTACVPDAPVGACMVSSEGTCRIWHQYGGGRPSLPQHGRGRVWSTAMNTHVMDDRILLKHGAGGRATRRLIEDVLVAGFDRTLPEGSIGLSAMDDGAAIRVGDRWLVITTDSHVVHPIVFPGGDIGRLAVSGAVNDLAMMGATEVLALTCAVILEEGFPRADLVRVQDSMRRAALEAQAPIVTGDTKVMGRGEIDGIVLNTTGVAFTDRVVTDAGLRPGDVLIVTGTIGDHGLAIMTARHALALEGALVSDVAPINGLIRLALAAGGNGIRAMKDPTRGGLASALHEMAAKAGVTIVLDEMALPITDEARAAGELLGIDPLHVANEGKAVIGVRPEVADAVLDALRRHPLGQRAAIVGSAVEGRPAVVVDTGVGRRLLVESDGEPMPRIC